MPAREEYNAQASIQLLSAVEGLIVSGKHATASRLLEVYLEEFPDDYKVLRSLGRLRLVQGRPEEAAELLERTIELQTRLRVRENSTVQDKQPALSSASPRHDAGDDDFDLDDVDYSNSIAREAEASRKYYSYTEQRSATTRGTVVNYQDTLPLPREDTSGPGKRGEMASGSSVYELERPLHEGMAGEAAAPVRTGITPDALDTEARQQSRDQEADETPEAILPVDESIEDRAGEEPGDDDDEDLDFLLDTNAKKPAVSCQEIDCRVLDEHLEELDEEPTYRELEDEISVGGRLTREERALQEAIQLGQEFGWDNEGVMILAEVFTAYWWSSAKRSMRRELEAGLHPDELQLAIIARRVWAGNEEYGLNIRGYAYPAMSWSLALEFIRSFRSYPEQEEMEIILDEMYVEWHARASLQREYSSFHEYFLNRLKFPCGDFLASPAISIGYGQEYLDNDYEAGAGLGYNTPLNRALEDYGLLPDIWADEMTYRDGSDRPVEDGEAPT